MLPLPLVKGMKTVGFFVFFGLAKLCHRPRMAKNHQRGKKNFLTSRTLGQKVAASRGYYLCGQKWMHMEF